MTQVVLVFDNYPNISQLMPEVPRVGDELFYNAPGHKGFTVTGVRWVLHFTGAIEANVFLEENPNVDCAYLGDGTRSTGGVT